MSNPKVVGHQLETNGTTATKYSRPTYVLLSFSTPRNFSSRLLHGAWQFFEKASSRAAELITLLRIVIIPFFTYSHHSFFLGHDVPDEPGHIIHYWIQREEYESRARDEQLSMYMVVEGFCRSCQVQRQKNKRAWRGIYALYVAAEFNGMVWRHRGCRRREPSWGHGAGYIAMYQHTRARPHRVLQHIYFYIAALLPYIVHIQWNLNIRFLWRGTIIFRSTYVEVYVVSREFYIKAYIHVRYSL